MITTYKHDDYYIAFLTALKIEPRLQARRALAAVSIAESPGTDNGFNPFNAVEDWPGAVSINSVGVKRYKTFLDGVLAAAELFSGSHWPAFRLALKNAPTRTPMLAEVQKVYSSWGSQVDFTFSTTMVDARRALAMKNWS